MAATRRAELRLAIVGGGLAGALLAHRVARSSTAARVDLFTSRPPGGEDASGVSGGLVRGFEPDAGACRPAAESLAEIRASAVLREWTGFRETGSLYVLPGGAPTGGPGGLGAEVPDPAALGVLAAYLPGSAEVLDRDRILRDFPFRSLPEGAVAVRERYAGHIAPGRLRDAALKDATGAGVTLRSRPVELVTEGPSVRTADGEERSYDRVVLAAGAWTPGLLARAGLPTGGLRVKQIQYSVGRTSLTGLDAFVDETSGLYGRPYGEGGFLLGLPTDRWDVDPDRTIPDPGLAEDVMRHVWRVFGVPFTAERTVASSDCYHEEPGLALRAVAPGVHTFTAGSGGAAKSVLSVSRTAAVALLA